MTHLGSSLLLLLLLFCFVFVKLANILVATRGQLKVADLGSIRDADRTALALTTQVVSLFYRAPELLLLTKHYTHTLDMWSIGCLFYELLTYRRLFAGKNELDMMQRIMHVLGAPPDDVWRDCYAELPGISQRVLDMRSRFPKRSSLTRIPELAEMKLSDNCIDLLQCLLDWDPRRRIDAATALKHPFFDEEPLPLMPIPFADDEHDDERDGNKRESDSDSCSDDTDSD
jgi:cell division cycle 2-like